ncbi:hypothetical protein [Acidovorax sp. SRB_24]|uniref:hypothetical protein n=1 Tax=Acidovorax sp. SRB_24 TaxID=1962700 RepID=UPI00145DFCFF|nr:hypothetical protein [Acidovorax sp. SRB_24]
MNTPHPAPSLPAGRRQSVALTQPLALDGSPLVMRGFDGDHDLEGLCQLFSDVFGQPMDSAHWRWKYMQAPGSQHYHALAAHAHTGQLLGHMGVAIVPGVRGGQAIRMAHASDLMVSPLARTGLGSDSVYRHIMHTVRERAFDAGPSAPPLFMYGFPGQRPATLAMRLGIQRRLQICTEYATAAPAAAPQGLGLRLRHWWGQRSQLRVLAQAQPAQDAAWSDAVLDPLWHSRAQELAAQPPEQAQPSIAKTGAYLRWRYLHHPQQHAQPGAPLYTLWLLSRPGHAPQGWLVTRQHHQPTVVDSSLPPGDDWTAAALQALPAQAAGPWISWLPHPGAQARQTPVWATAMQGAQFYDQWPSPTFQPGDTDVF